MGGKAYSWCSLGAALTAASFALPALAQQQNLAVPIVAAQERPVTFIAGTSVTWDSNPLRLTDTDDVQALTGKSSRSDRIVSAYAGIRLDKPYAQQRFQAEVLKSAYRYENFSYLNFDPLDYRGAWLWQLSPRLSGVISADRTEALANYADFRNVAQRNVRTTENQALSADWSAFGGWHVLGAVARREVKNSVPFSQLPGYDGRGGETGAKYEWAPDRTMGIIFRSRDISYVDQPLDPVTLQDDGGHVTDRELFATWRLSGKSDLEGRVAAVDYRSNHFRERDFSGPTGRLAFNWTPTGKLKLSLLASRDLGLWNTDYASYRVDKAIALVPAWQISGTASVRVSLRRFTTDYRNPVPAFTGPLRKDTSNAADLTLDWSPRRNLVLTGNVQRELRDSNDPTGDFQRTAARLDVSFLF